MSTENTGRDHCFEIVTKHRIYQLVAKSQEEMLEWMKVLSSHTQLHIENEYIHQAEEMIIKASQDKYNQYFGQDLEEALKAIDLGQTDISQILTEMDRTLNLFGYSSSKTDMNGELDGEELQSFHDIPKRKDEERPGNEQKHSLNENESLLSSEGEKRSLNEDEKRLLSEDEKRSLNEERSLNEDENTSLNESLTEEDMTMNEGEKRSLNGDEMNASTEGVKIPVNDSEIRNAIDYQFGSSPDSLYKDNKQEIDD